MYPNIQWYWPLSIFTLMSYLPFECCHLSFPMLRLSECLNSKTFYTLFTSWIWYKYTLFIKFACLWLNFPLKNFSLISRRHYYRWRATNVDLYSALAIEQRGFFNVPHLLWHGPTVYTGHLRGLVTLTHVCL